MCAVCGRRSAPRHPGRTGTGSPLSFLSLSRAPRGRSRTPQTTTRENGTSTSYELQVASFTTRHGRERDENGMKQSTPAVTEENATAKSVAADSVPAYGAKRDSQQRDSQHARRFWMCAVCRMPRNHTSVDVCCKCHAVRGSERKARGETLAEAVVASVLSKY